VSFLKETEILDARDSVMLTKQLCNIESVSGDERHLADVIETMLRAEAPHLSLTRNGDTIVARTELGRARRVLIAGHLDTVPVNGNLPVREFTDAHGHNVIWGRGTVDMKAGVAVQLVLAAELTNPHVDITWVWYDHEEVSSDLNGLGRTMRGAPELFIADFAILGEPTAGTIEGGCNGTLRARVSMHGLRAHSARSWMGINAIHRAAAILQRLADFEAETVRVDGLDYRESLSAVGIGGGVAGNVIPDRCDIEVNYRFAPSRSEAEAVALVRDFFDDADEVEIIDLAPGARPGLDDELAQSLIEAVGAEPRAKVGWTDVARFSALGIAAVNFGPGDPSLAHADDEQVPVAQILQTERSLRAWLNR
jgi:succinyl-diaminopimelate desuccinylase